MFFATSSNLKVRQQQQQQQQQKLNYWWVKVLSGLQYIKWGKEKSAFKPYSEYLLSKLFYNLNILYIYMC